MKSRHHRNSTGHAFVHSEKSVSHFKPVVRGDCNCSQLQNLQSYKMIERLMWACLSSSFSLGVETSSATERGHSVDLYPAEQVLASEVLAVYCLQLFASFNAIVASAADLL